MLIVMPGSSTAGGAMGGFGSMPTLTWDDLRAIQTEIPTVRAAAAQLRTNAPGHERGPELGHADPRHLPGVLRDPQLGPALGHPFTQVDVDTGTKVAVLGQTVADKLFGQNANPVGQNLRIKNVPFVVVGVLEKKGQSQWGRTTTTPSSSR